MWLHRLLRLFLSDILCLFHSTTINIIHPWELFIQSLSFSLQWVSSSLISSFTDIIPFSLLLFVVDFPPRMQLVLHDLMISNFQSRVRCSSRLPSSYFCVPLCLLSLGKDMCSISQLIASYH